MLFLKIFWAWIFYFFDDYSTNSILFPHYMTSKATRYPPLHCSDFLQFFPEFKTLFKCFFSIFNWVLDYIPTVWHKRPKRSKKKGPPSPNHGPLNIFTIFYDFFRNLQDSICNIQKVPNFQLPYLVGPRAWSRHCSTDI